MPRPRPQRPKLELRRGVYVIVWWENGQRRRISVGTADEAHAKRALADFDAELDRPHPNLTVSAALDRYTVAKLDKVMAPGRLKDAAGAIRLGLGELRVDQVTQTQWDRYAKERVTRTPRNAKPGTHKPRPISTGTLRREFNVLRAALRKAWKEGFLIKPPTLTAPPDSAPRDRYLTEDEARALIGACQSLHIKVFVSLAIFTGARRGSILSLTWDRVDFTHGRVDFQEPGRKITAKRRAIVPMNSSLRAVLEMAHKARQSDYVVEYAGGPVPYGLRWSFAKLCQRAGLTWKPTPHHIKHSVASWLAMKRVPIDQAADLLQTDPKTLRRTYRKFDPDYLKSVVNALEL